MKVIKPPLASKSSTKYQDKIELFKCPLGSMNCKQKLSEINKNYFESYSFLYGDEYQPSIQLLKVAFNKTFELQEPICKDCSEILRFIIIGSLKNVHDDLKKLSEGYFGKRKYKASYDLVKNVLEELKSCIK